MNNQQRLLRHARSAARNADDRTTLFVVLILGFAALCVYAC